MYLQHSPLGSLRVSDFKQIHFLLKNGRIKLTDLDDVTSLEPGCEMQRDPPGDVRTSHDLDIKGDLSLRRDLKSERTEEQKQNKNVQSFPDLTGQTTDESWDPQGANMAIPGVKESSLSSPKGCGYNLKCLGGICQGFNALHNLAHMNKHYFRTLLYGDCEDQESACSNLRMRLDNLSISAEQLKELLYQMMRVPYIPGYSW